MGLKKLLRMSTFVLGLGMMLSGMNSMAMEEKGTETSTKAEESKQSAFDEAYGREISSGKSESYAKYYATLTVLENMNKAEAKIRAKAYEDYLMELSDEDLADSYAREMTVSLKGDDAESKYVETDIEIEESKRPAFEKVYNQELLLSKNECHSKYYAKLVVLDGIEKEKARIMSEIFRDIIRSGKNEVFANSYAESIANGFNEAEAKFKAKMICKALVKEEKPRYESPHPWRRRIVEGRVYNPPVNFITMDLEEGGNVLESTGEEDTAESSENMVEAIFRFLVNMEGRKTPEIEEEIRQGKTTLYRYHYIIFRYIEGLSEEEAKERSEALCDRIRDDEVFASFILEYLKRGENYHRIISKAEIAEQGYDSSGSVIGALYYAELVAHGLNSYIADKQTTEFGRKIIEGKSNIYAHFYAHYCIQAEMIDHCYKPADTDRIDELAAIAEKEVLSGRSNIYAFHYVDLIADGVSENEARKRAEMFEKEKGRVGKSDIYVRIYTGLIFKGMDNDKARRQAEIAEREVLAQNSYDYSIYYAELILSGLNANQAEKRAKEFEQMIRAGKSETYARFYSELKVRGTYIYDIERQVAIAENEVAKGRSNDYAFYYSELIMGGLSEGLARERAEESERKSEEGESFSEFYAESMKQGIGEAAARRQAMIANEKFKEGYRKEVALYYAELIVRGAHVNNAMNQSKIFKSKLKEGKSDFYARCFAKLVGRGMSFELAEKQSEMAEKLFEKRYKDRLPINNYGWRPFTETRYERPPEVSDNSFEIENMKIEAFCYAELILIGLNEKDARTASIKFADKVGKNKIFC